MEAIMALSLHTSGHCEVGAGPAFTTVSTPKATQHLDLLRGGRFDVPMTVILVVLPYQGDCAMSGVVGGCGQVRLGRGGGPPAVPSLGVV